MGETSLAYPFVPISIYELQHLISEQAFKKTDLSDIAKKIRICTDPCLDIATCMRTPKETHYEYDDDPYHQGSIKCMRYGRYCDHLRLNIEVDLFGRCAGREWPGTRKPRLGVFEGVCIGVHWG